MSQRKNFNKRGDNKASKRAMKDLYSGGLRKAINESPICPYCGGKMILKSGEEIGSFYKEQMRFVCENYPECETSARAEYSHGKWRMISTPANKNLRILRNEAHFWMEQLVNTGCMSSKEQVAWYISSHSILANGKRIHIGQCREAACKDIIKICIELLFEKKDSFDRFPGFYISATRLDKELWEKVKQISFKPEAKYAVGANN